MTTPGLASVVNAPPLVPPPINLLRSSRKPNDPAGTRWTAGVAYSPAMNVESVGYAQCGTASTMPTGAAHPHGRIVWFPVVQVVTRQCSTIGWQATDWRQQLDDLLAAGLPKFLETELWTGAIAQREGLDNEWLAHNTATDITPGGTAVSVKRGLGAMEAALGDYGTGAQGMIHVRRDTVPDLTHVRREGNLLLTETDNIVVPGVGYKGTDPSGNAATAGTSWIYGTGLTDVRTDTTVYIPDENGGQPEIDRATNTAYLRAEREVLVSWDTLVHLACHVTLDT